MGLRGREEVNQNTYMLIGIVHGHGLQESSSEDMGVSGVGRGCEDGCKRERGILILSIIKNIFL